MRELLTIALNELRLIFMDRSVWVNVVIVPVVVTFAVGAANAGLNAGGSGTLNYVNVDVLDYDDSPLSRALQAQIVAANEAVRLCPLPDASADVDPCALDSEPLTTARALARLDESVTRAFIEIPAGFEAAVIGGEPVSIVYRSNESVTQPSFVLQAVETAITRMTSTQTAARVGAAVTDGIPYLRFGGPAERAAFVDGIRQSAQGMWAANPIQIEETQPELRADPGALAGYGQSVPGMGSMYVLFAVLPMSAAFLRDRKQWTIQRAMTTPVSRAQIMGGKLLGYFVIGLLQLSIIFTFGLLLGLRFGGDPLALALTMVAFTLAATGLALLLATVVKSETQATSISLLVTLTLAPLGGAWWPLDIVPEWMRVAGHVSPIAWAMDAYSALIFRDAGLSAVVVPVLVLLGMAAVFFVTGVRRFRFE